MPEPRTGEVLRAAASRIDQREARWLLEKVCACTQAEIIAHPERMMSEAQTTRFAALVERRAAGEPLAYLLGSAWFGGLEFRVTPAVLIPRPETERLVEIAVRCVQTEKPRVVDLGTGSGCIAILFARRCPQAEITAVDISADALEVARHNAARHGVALRFLEGDWYAPLAGERFDLILANPPYVAEGDPHLEQNGLPFEPRGALTDGAGDGLGSIRRIIGAAAHHLKPGGWLLMEHGYNQAFTVREWLSGAGFREVASWRDDADIERVSGGRGFRED